MLSRVILLVRRPSIFMADHAEFRTLYKLIHHSSRAYMPCDQNSLETTGFMMMSSNGNIFRVTGPLWRESTGHRWFSSQTQWRGAVMFSLICNWTNGWANEPDAGDLRRHRAHCDFTVMIRKILSHNCDMHVGKQLPDPVPIQNSTPFYVVNKGNCYSTYVFVVLHCCESPCVIHRLHILLNKYNEMWWII